MEIKFEGQWPEIREQIQKFAIDHLNIKFGAEAPVVSQVINQMSVSPSAQAEPKPRGRPKGFRPLMKARTQPVAAAPEAQVAPPEEKPAAPEVVVLEQAPAEPVQAPTLELCVGALRKVYDKFGMEKSL